MTNYNVKLAQDYDDISARVKRGMLPLVARNPAIGRAVGDYAVAHAHHYDAKRAKGENPPINFKDSDALDRFADLIMHEELTWSHPDKMTILEYPTMSDSQLDEREEKYYPKAELQFGDLRFLGKRKVSGGMEDDARPTVRMNRVIPHEDATFSRLASYADLHGALANVGLTNRQRQAIDLVYFDDMTQEGAADVMDVGQDVVSRHLSSGIRKLREYMT